MGGRAQRRKPRARRTTTWRRWIEDPSEASAALNKATGLLTLAGIGADVDEERLAPLRADVAEKQAAVDACCEVITFTALQGPQFEDLMAEHPPTPEDDEQGLTHHDPTFLPALLAACCDNGWTVEDWVEEIADLSVGERAELRATVTEANTRTWSQQIPKD